jgi:hypothetical protein
VSPPAPTPKQVYADATAVMEQALAEAARAQWAGEQPDLHRQRRALIEARHAVPNDRLEPVTQVIRDLLTTYVAILDEQSRRDRYERDQALGGELRDDLERLRPRAGRHGLPVVDDRLSAFVVPQARRPEPRAAAARPRAPRPSEAPLPPAVEPKRRRRRRRSRSAPA